METRRNNRKFIQRKFDENKKIIRIFKEIKAEQIRFLPVFVI